MRRVCSALILTCLGTQALVVARVFHPPRAFAHLSPLRRLPSPSLWPFVDYPMFSEAHAPGERVPRVVLVVDWSTGSSESFYPERRVPGLDVEAMIRECRGGREQSALWRLAELERLRSVRARSVRIERTWLELERDGFVAGVPELLLTLAVPDGVVVR